MSDLEKFIKAAQEYSDWCVSEPGEEVQEARQALEHLAKLYSIALRLELPSNLESDIDGKGADNAAWQRVFERAKALPFQYYSEVFDPLILPPKKNKPIHGDLADDIADIYRDLSEGLSSAHAGRLVDAEWEFVFSFRYHWGEHATSAIRALHSWCSQKGF